MQLKIVIELLDSNSGVEKRVRMQWKELGVHPIYFCEVPADIGDEESLKEAKDDDTEFMMTTVKGFFKISFSAQKKEDVDLDNAYLVFCYAMCILMVRWENRELSPVRVGEQVRSRTIL